MLPVANMDLRKGRLQKDILSCIIHSCVLERLRVEIRDILAVR